MKCKLIRNMSKVVEFKLRGKTRSQIVPFPAGTIIESPDAYVLCDLGNAEPADDECKAACKQRTPAETAEAVLLADMRDLGLHPEDQGLYRAGIITGYNPDFNPETDPPSKAFLAGPNWTDAFAAELDGDGDDADGEAE